MFLGSLFLVIINNLPGLFLSTKRQAVSGLVYLVINHVGFEFTLQVHEQD